MRARLRLSFVLAALIAAVTLLASGGATAKDEAYKPVAVAEDWVTIRGVCRIEKAVEIPRTPVHHRGVESTIPFPRLKYDPDHRGLADCVVFLREIGKGKPWFKRSGYILIANDRYEPHVQVLKPETQLKLVNAGAHNTNLHGYYRGKTMLNVMVQPDAALFEVGEAWLERDGVYHFRDDICAHYSASVIVAKHPYYSHPTSTTGRYELTQVPPGTYELVCWHGGMQQKPISKSGDRVTGFDFGPDVEVSRKVTVVPGADLVVDFTVPAPR